MTETPQTPPETEQEPLGATASLNGSIPPIDELVGEVTPEQLVTLLAQMDLRIRANQAMLAIVLVALLLVIVELERIRRA